MITDIKKEKKTDIEPVQTIGDLISFDELDHFLDDFMRRKWPRFIDWDFSKGFERGYPRVDILDKDPKLEIRVSLPGIKKDHLEVSLNNQSVTIKADFKEEKVNEGQYFKNEIVKGLFQRTVNLPFEVVTDSAKANFEDGLLKIELDKSNPSQNKTIKIN
jgi:HSP20 family protein